MVFYLLGPYGEDGSLQVVIQEVSQVASMMGSVVSEAFAKLQYFLHVQMVSQGDQLMFPVLAGPGRSEVGSPVSIYRSKGVTRSDVLFSSKLALSFLRLGRV